MLTSPNTCSTHFLLYHVNHARILYLYTIWEGVLPSGWHHQILGASHVDNGLLQASLPGDIQVYDQQYMMNQVYCNACYDQQVIFNMLINVIYAITQYLPFYSIHTQD